MAKEKFLMKKGHVLIPRKSITDLMRPKEDMVAIVEGLKERAILKKIETEIDAKWISLGIPGTAQGEVTAVGAGYYRQYRNSRIYFTPNKSVFWVCGAIGERYNALNGPNSWLGWPTSDEQPFSEDGRVTTFENGAIYWWADTGAFDLGNIAVRYKGLHCFGETDWDQGSNEDEPYVIFAPLSAVTNANAIRTNIYTDVDAGEGRPDFIELYRGLPYGMLIPVTLMEHDFGNPDEFRGVVDQAVDKGIEGTEFAIQHVPGVGPTIAKIIEPLLKELKPLIKNALNDALDTQDDYLGADVIVVTPKEMVTMAVKPKQVFNGIQWDKETEILGSSSGASYKVYIDVQWV